VEKNILHLKFKFTLAKQNGSAVRSSHWSQNLLKSSSLLSHSLLLLLLSKIALFEAVYHLRYHHSRYWSTFLERLHSHLIPLCESQSPRCCPTHLLASEMIIFGVAKVLLFWWFGIQFFTSSSSSHHFVMFTEGLLW